MSPARRAQETAAPLVAASAPERRQSIATVGRHLLRSIRVSLWEEDVQFVRGDAGKHGEHHQGAVKGEEELAGVDLLLSLGS